MLNFSSEYSFNLMGHTVQELVEFFYISRPPIWDVRDLASSCAIYENVYLYK